MVLIFYMLIPTLFNQKSNTILHHSLKLSFGNLNEWICLSLWRFIIIWSPSLFLLVFLVFYLVKFASKFSVINFRLSEVLLSVEYDNVVLHHLPKYRPPLTSRLTLKRNTEDIRQNAPRLHLWYKQWPKNLCCILYDTLIKSYIQNDTNTRYVTVEFKLHKN